MDSVSWRYGCGFCYGPRFLPAVACLLPAVALSGAASAPAAVRGVAPADLGRYAPGLGPGGEAVFRCLHRKNSTTPRQLVPIDAVNDNYCDCHDGSDEPGTEACAGQRQTLFYCENAQSVPSYIFTSSVNDGVCDCCDGTDEWRLGSTCADTCAEEGRLLREQHERDIAELIAGLRQRRAYVDAGEAAKRSQGEELRRLQAEIRALEASDAAAPGLLELLDVTTSQSKAATFLASLLILTSGIFFLTCYRCMRKHCSTRGRRKRDTPTDILERIGLLIRLRTDTLMSEQGQGLGIGVKDSDAGGLEITSIDCAGSVGQWNESQEDEVGRIRVGDRLIEVSHTNPNGEEFLVTSGQGMLQLLRSPDRLLLTIAASRDESELVIFSNCLELEHLNIVEHIQSRRIESGRAGLEVLSVSPDVEEWNRKMRSLGACFTQSVEVGDRLIVSAGEESSVPSLLRVAKLRRPHEVRVDAFEVLLERENPDDKLGLRFRGSLASPLHLEVLEVKDDGLMCTHNALPEVRKVLAGDRIVSVNGVEGVQAMQKECRSELVAMRLERYVSVGEPTARAPNAQLLAPLGTATDVAPPVETVSASPGSRGKPGLPTYLLLALGCLVLAVLPSLVEIVPTWFGAPKAATSGLEKFREDSAPSGSAADSPVVSEYAKWMDGADGVKTETPDLQPDADGTDSSSGASEYTKWMEGAGEALKHSGATTDTDAQAQDAGVASGTATRQRTSDSSVVDAAVFGGMSWSSLAAKFHDVGYYAADVYGAALGTVKTKADRIQEKLKRIQAQARDIEEELKRLADEDALAWSNLKGTCQKTDIAEYKYEICFYETAKQGSTHIGRWKGWESPRVGLFDDGDMCYGGPARSLRVRFQCGSAVEILDVSEPSRCSYQATMKHPAACSAEDARTGREPRFPGA